MDLKLENDANKKFWGCIGIGIVIVIFFGLNNDTDNHLIISLKIPVLTAVCILLVTVVVMSFTTKFFDRKPRVESN